VNDPSFSQLPTKRTPANKSAEVAGDLQPLDEYDDQFGELAVASGLITRKRLQDAFECRGPLQSLSQVLVEEGDVSTADRHAIEQLLGSGKSLHSGKSPSDSSENSTVSTPGKVDTANIKVKLPERAPRRANFGDYEILDKIAQGGMGVVFKARQITLNRLVALKTIRSGSLADEEQIQRFYSEAEAAGKLDHPHIVPVFEVGKTQGQHFFSMAFVDGPSLHAEVKTAPLEVAEAASIMQTVALAVQFAHDNDIIHRDIKPQNILLDQRRQPRVTDFGLAKHLLDDSHLTEAGLILGTPNFMAPEQAAGQSHLATASADIYSLGATFYFMMTGRPPFQAASTAETIRQVLETEPAPPRRLNPAIPRDLETICLKCLRKSPSQRYETAAALAEDLERWAKNEPILARRASLAQKAWLWSKRRPAVVSSVAVLLITALIALGVVESKNAANRAAIATAELDNDQKRANALVESVLTAPPAGLPYAMELLSPLQAESLPILQERFADPEIDPTQQLHAAFALAKFGDAQTDLLVAAAATVPEEECGNLIAALSGDREAVQLLRQEAAKIKSTEQPDWTKLARLAIVALYLGDSSTAVDMCQQRPDPIQRTVFIETLGHWHGSPLLLAKAIQNEANAALQYAAIAGVAQADSISPQDRAPLQQLLTALYTDTKEPAVRSAAAFALRRIGVSPPTAPVQTDRWRVNSVGMTLVKIPPGTFQRKIAAADSEAVQQVTISRPFWMSTRETLNVHFAEYREEMDQPPAATNDLEKPILDISWNHAVMFCNWLSRKEGLEECYEQGATAWFWEWDLSANGYRLPTEAEWEHACRATSTTDFAHGNDHGLLHRYAILREKNVWPGGVRLPNAFGLFDMSGNTYEWCFDQWASTYPDAEALVDPQGPSGDTTQRVIRGGAHSHSEYSLKSETRNHSDSGRGASMVGFRVVRSR